MYPRDGTVIKNREEKLHIGFDFRLFLDEGEAIVEVLSLSILNRSGVDVATEFRAGEPELAIIDSLDNDGNVVHASGAVSVWTKEYADSEQAPGTYRPKLKVVTSTGQRPILMIPDPANSDLQCLPFLVVVDGTTKLPPGVR